MSDGEALGIPVGLMDGVVEGGNLGTVVGVLVGCSDGKVDVNRAGAAEKMLDGWAEQIFDCACGGNCECHVLGSNERANN